MTHEPVKPPITEVVVSHPGNQHAYETAVAAQEAGLLRWFATGLYRTGRGMSDPALLSLLPQPIRDSFDRFQRRRWHRELDSAKVVTIIWPALFSLLLRRTPWRSRVETWSYQSCDIAVARRILKGRHGAAVHAFEGAALHTFRAAKKLDLPTILDVPSAHEYFLSAVEAEGDQLPNQPRITRRVRAERELADYALAPSSFVIRCLLENGVPEERVVHVPYGADPEVFQPATNGDRPFRVLFVGLIGLRKGTGYLLEAWRQLALSDAELVLVGPCDRFGKRLLKRLPANCRWVGQVPNNEVHRWFQLSDVFVFPSLAEGSAIVTYQAMAAGLPIVTTSNSGSVARDGKEGFLVPARNVTALAERVQLLYERPDVRTRMASDARRLIESAYTWHHYRARLRVVYQAILDHCSPQEALSTARLDPSTSSEPEETAKDC